jgi:hypothetical protein
VFCLTLAFCPIFGFSQSGIPFEKHGFSKNCVTGNKWGIEIPIQAAVLLTSDYDYEDTDAQGPFLLGVGIKGTLKNGWGRGVGLGFGADYSTNGYIKANILIDLDFLFTYSIPLEKMNFTPSMFTKFELTKLIARVDNQAIQEYYLYFNILKFQFGSIAFEMGPSIGLFRNKYVPYFAEKGLNYRLSYIFIR